MNRNALLAAAALAVLTAPILWPPSAHAEKLAKLDERLQVLKTEADRLGQGIKAPNRNDRAARNRAERKLIDGQLAFSIGNYDDAAVMLYDYVEQYPTSPSYDEALYYLAEALFQKRDSVASRSYFTKLVKDVGARSKFYQQSLERLIELSLTLSDGANVDQWLRALDNLPPSKRRASVPYVRGKYEYFKDRFDEALKHFALVPPETEYFFQARYFMGTCHVNKGDLGQAAKIFQEITRVEPKTNKDKRVIELSHMALGRLYYEREQPSKAIDEYTRIDRESDIFDEALFEVAWVYVKDSQYDKALRALELLALADPNSAKMPEVRILEGNLRIRKAQALGQKDVGNSSEEYAKAVTLFKSTHAAYYDPHKQLQKVIDTRTDPRAFIAQITGRVSEAFEVNVTMPEIAASWIRREPDVNRIVSIETDLGQIEDEIKDAEATIERLERALSSSSRIYIFPRLADKRTRATEILEEMFRIRLELVAKERKLIKEVATTADRSELNTLRARRKAAAEQLASLPGADVAYGKRIEQARNKFTVLDQKAAEVATIIDASRATLVALERYVEQEKAAGRGPTNIFEARKAIEELKTEIADMSTELGKLRREAILAKDEAGTGDEVAMRARELRAQLRAALTAEHDYMTRFASNLTGSKRATARKIATMMRTSQAVTKKLDKVQETVDEIVEFALTDVRSSLVEEKTRLAAYKREFVEYEAESRVLGGDILAISFKVVRDKFYDVIIRSDIGVIDVSWSQKESIDELSARLGLDKLREMRTLREEFRDIIEDKRGEK